MTNFSRVVSLPLLLIAALPATSFAQRVTFGGGGSTGGTTKPATPPATPPTTTQTTPKPATDAKDAEPKGDDVPAPKEWQERDAALGESSTLQGGAGLLHTQHMVGGAPGQFRLGFTTEFFSSGFLCTADQPCRDPRTGMTTTDNSTDHIGGTITLGVSIVKYLEAYAATGAYANSNDKNRPSLLQVLGDTTFGVKGLSADALKIFHFGGFAELRLVNGTGFVGLAGSGTSARFGAGATLDFREVDKRDVGLGGLLGRTSLNLSYFVDNSAAVVEGTERARGTPVTRIERYGLKLNRTDHFDIALGYEMFFVDDRIRPFLEYNVAIPINRQGYGCPAVTAGTTTVNGDFCLKNEQIPQHKLTLGGRFFPWKNGFSTMLAFDFGLPPSSTRFIDEISPVSPWTLYLGLGWAIDTWDRPPVEKIKTVQKTVEGKPPKRGKLAAFVHEKDKQEGIAAAQIGFEGQPEWPTVLTGPDGKFTSWELPEGEYKLNVKADGYKDGQCTGTLPKGGVDGTADCPLEALPRIGTIVGHVKDAETFGPIANATVKLTDPKGKTLQVQSDGTGAFRFEGVEPGTGSLDVEADGYLVQVEPAEIKVRQEVTHDVSVRAKPKQSLVQLTKTTIDIKQQVQFAVDQAIILPESNPLLTEIADTLIRNPRIKRVEIQGHTDNTGTAEHNQTLSEQRAEAVRKWLVDHGVGADRLVAKGYGQTKPLVPNVTAANKAKNRRVQFVILDQDPEGATPPPGTGPAKKPPPF